MPSNGKNWENKDPAPRVIFSSLSYHWSCSLDPLTFHITGHAVWRFRPSPDLSSPSMLLVLTVRPPEMGNEKGGQRIALKR